MSPFLLHRKLAQDAEQSKGKSGIWGYVTGQS
jgi:hypothetical protein